MRIAVRTLRSTNATRRPTADAERKPAQLEGAVTGVGSPSGRPVAGSTEIRQRFIVPPRELAKKRERPSADHFGLQST